VNQCHDVQRPIHLPVPGPGSRCRIWSPEEVSMGAVPSQEAKWARSANRVMSTTSTSGRADGATEFKIPTAMQ
jgi:hypothetical protein